MGLGLPQSTGGGDRTAIIKYDARAGRIHRIDRTNANGSWETNEVEITQGFQAIFDLENIETGWLNFPAGGAPDIQVAKVGQPLPPRPSDKHRTGFRVLMKLGKSIGGDLREMASNAKVSIAAMDALYDAYVAARDKFEGKLPVVTLASTISVKSSGKGADGSTQTSTNYQPVWEITAWADRPPELNGAADADPEPEAKAASTLPKAAAANVGAEF